MHILVVEDERALCETVVRSLRRLAYCVDFCFDGSRAAELLGETDSIIVASGSPVYAFAAEITMRMWHHLNIVTPFLRLGVLLNESENVAVVQ